LDNKVFDIIDAWYNHEVHTVHICDNTYRNFYVSVTILFFCPQIEPF